jgi:hypothetical protein
LSQHRDRILGNGTGFPSFGRPREEERAGVLEDLWRISSDEDSHPGVGEHYATGHAFGVRAGFDSEVKLREAEGTDSGVRPFGVSLLVAGWDVNRGSSLYQVDPSGSYWAWKASAIGKNMVNAKTFLEKRCAFCSRFTHERGA